MNNNKKKKDLKSMHSFVNKEIINEGTDNESVAVYKYWVDYDYDGRSYIYAFKRVN